MFIILYHLFFSITNTYAYINLSTFIRVESYKNNPSQTRRTMAYSQKEQELIDDLHKESKGAIDKLPKIMREIVIQSHLAGYWKGRKDVLLALEKVQ